MKKENYFKMKSDPALLKKKKRYFVGQSGLSDISRKLGISDQKIYYAQFKNGAKTKVHYHEGGQILLVTNGSGILVLYEKANLSSAHVKIKQNTRVTLNRGDMVYIPRNTLHWHGAAKGKDLVHMAFNGFSPRGREAETIWYESDFKSIARKLTE